MFCPSCGSEFRPGFTHCASCDVDLVESLEAPGARPDLPRPGASAAPAQRTRGGGPVPEQPPIAFCGFLSLEEASEARARLKTEGVRSEILIREDDPVAGGEAPKDTFWLRLSPAYFRKAAALLGYDEAPEVEGEDGEDGENGEMVACSECGEDVGADETSCPHCGAKFEEA